MEIHQAFAKSLKAARKASWLTQEDFSIVSSRTYMSTLERGLKSPTLEKIQDLSEVMQLHPLTLLTLTYLAASKQGGLGSLLDRVKKEVAEVQTYA